MSKITLVLLVVFFIYNKGYGQERKEKFDISGFVDFNGYYDTREFSVLTYNILANITVRLQYFSLTNYQSASQSLDLESTYSEHNLRWKLKKNASLDVTLQYVLRGGVENDDIRFGLRSRLSAIPKLSPFFKKIRMFYSINPMFIQFRQKAKTKYMTIIEHVYNIKIAPNIFHNRLYLGGFIDQNFVYPDNGGVAFKWVSEHQLGFRVIDQLYVILEYRINDFLPSENYGLGYGLEYKIII